VPPPASFQTLDSALERLVIKIPVPLTPNNSLGAKNVPYRTAVDCLGCLGKPFIHFFLEGEQLLDARALLHAFEMRHDLGEP
jgi:hypothetical protein